MTQPCRYAILLIASSYNRNTDTLLYDDIEKYAAIRGFSAAHCRKEVKYLVGIGCLLAYNKGDGLDTIGYSISDHGREALHLLHKRFHRPMLRIPVKAAARIAEDYGYDQVIIIARRVGVEGEVHGEHVTTYGTTKAYCDAISKAADYIKTAIMKWPSPDGNKNEKTASPT